MPTWGPLERMRKVAEKKMEGVADSDSTVKMVTGR